MLPHKLTETVIIMNWLPLKPCSCLGVPLGDAGMIVVDRIGGCCVISEIKIEYPSVLSIKTENEVFLADIGVSTGVLLMQTVEHLQQRDKLLC